MEMLMEDLRNMRNILHKHKINNTINNRINNRIKRRISMVDMDTVMVMGKVEIVGRVTAPVMVKTILGEPTTPIQLLPPNPPTVTHSQRTQYPPVPQVQAVPQVPPPLFTSPHPLTPLLPRLLQQPTPPPP